MRLCNFKTAGGNGYQAGVVLDEKIFGLEPLLDAIWGSDDREESPRLPRLDWETVGAIGQLPSKIGDFDGMSVNGIPNFELNEVSLGPPVMPVASFRDFYAFEAHVKNARARRGLQMVPEWYAAPAFYFSNPRSIVGHDAPITAPPYGEWLDYELEVACVLGRAGRDIQSDEAEQYIAGLTILNDWSLRDVQRQEMKVGLGPAKGKDFATSLGPYLVTLDELEDRRDGDAFNLDMVARVNGVTYSQGNLRDLHFSFGEMIAQASQGVLLQPGDVIGTGTVGTGCILELGPEKVGGWLRDGDVVELEVERLGVLRNQIVSAK